jgi:hypothetical protein
MNVTRTAVFGLSAAAVAALIAGATTSTTRRLEPLRAIDTKAVELKGAELDAEIARLRDHLRPTTAPSDSTRNLFQFGSRTVPPRAAIAAAPAARAGNVPAPAPAAPPPAVTLVGIAQDGGADAPSRTAIISAFGELMILKEGQNIAYTYRVERIGADGVDLLVLKDGSTLHLPLK